MLGFIFSCVLSIVILLLPIYLWGYGTTLVLGYTWQRFRFISGLLLGGISVFLMYVIEGLKTESLLTYSYIFLSFLLTLFFIIYILTKYGSPYARKFLQKIAFGHIILIAIFGNILILLIKFFPELTIFLTLGFSLLGTSIFEEASKHLLSLGLAGQDYKFSEKDILSFTLFSVLGFVFAENCIYLVWYDASVLSWMYRSVFTLISHLIAAFFCAYYWWKALSYELLSFKYNMTFLFGFLLAVIAHTLYNYLSITGSILWLIMYAIIGYMSFIVQFRK